MRLTESFHNLADTPVPPEQLTGDAQNLGYRLHELFLAHPRAAKTVPSNIQQRLEHIFRTCLRPPSALPTGQSRSGSRVHLPGPDRTWPSEWAVDISAHKQALTHFQKIASTREPVSTMSTPGGESSSNPQSSSSFDIAALTEAFAKQLATSQVNQEAKMRQIQQQMQEELQQQMRDQLTELANKLKSHGGSGNQDDRQGQQDDGSKDNKRN
ncbi:hypothetical protein MMC22_011723 [Lobaria immixta]|nr:hypothetical protein [Lobaria immixta]